jgi:peroxiredoxin
MLPCQSRDRRERGGGIANAGLAGPFRPFCQVVQPLLRKGKRMSGTWEVLSISLLALVLILGFLLLGTLRVLGAVRNTLELLGWRLADLEATIPRRNGLAPGRIAPDINLPSVGGTQVALHDFTGCKVLLILTTTRVLCQSCRALVPDLNQLQHDGGIQVLLVADGDPESVHKWASEVQACFPVLVHEDRSVSNLYNVFARPYAFLINERGKITAKGRISKKEHLSHLFADAEAAHKDGDAEATTVRAEVNDKEVSFPVSHSGGLP